MTNFYRFSEFIYKGCIFPALLAFVAGVAAVATYFFAGIELMWLVNLSFLLTAITLVWGAVFMVVFAVNKIADWHEECQWRKENPNEEAYD